jgi:hypothetical protein
MANGLVDDGFGVKAWDRWRRVGRALPLGLALSPSTTARPSASPAWSVDAKVSVCPTNRTPAWFAFVTTRVTDWRRLIDGGEVGGQVALELVVVFLLRGQRRRDRERRSGGTVRAILLRINAFLVGWPLLSLA